LTSLFRCRTNPVNVIYHKEEEKKTFIISKMIAFIKTVQQRTWFWNGKSHVDCILEMVHYEKKFLSTHNNSTTLKVNNDELFWKSFFFYVRIVTEFDHFMFPWPNWCWNSYCVVVVVSHLFRGGCCCFWHPFNIMFIHHWQITQNTWKIPFFYTLY